jgi:hypothetical protein
LLLDVTACEWLPLALFVLDTVSVPGVVSATSSAFTVMPRPAPTASTPDENVRPAPPAVVASATESALTVMPLPAPTFSAPLLNVRPAPAADASTPPPPTMVVLLAAAPAHALYDALAALAALRWALPPP